MSNDNAGEKTRTPKAQGFLRNANRRRVSRFLRRGRKGVVDGKLVNTPVLRITAMGGRRRVDNASRAMVVPV